MAIKVSEDLKGAFDLCSQCSDAENPNMRKLFSIPFDSLLFRLSLDLCVFKFSL